MGNDERWPGQSWGAPEPLETRWETLTNLHEADGPMASTRWVKDPHRGYWADCCDRHRPLEIIEARRAETAKREAAERQLAAMHHRPYVPPVDDDCEGKATFLPFPPSATAPSGRVAAEPEPRREVAEVPAPPEPPRRFGFLLRRRP